MTKRLVTVIVFCFFFTHLCLAQPATRDEVFAVLIEDASNELVLQFIDPSTATAVDQSIQITLEDSERLITARLSLDGERLALLLNSATGWRLVALDDLTNGTQKLVAQLAPGEITEQSDSYLEWSPNGAYLSFIGADEPYGRKWLRIYQVETDLTVTYGSDDSLTESAVWSPNGQLVAASTTTCRDTACEAHILLYDIVNSQLVNAHETQRGNLAPCNLGWSPDGSYITYVEACHWVGSLVIHEVFLWDRLQDQTVQLTHFTNDVNSPAQALQDYMTGYSIFWLDEHTTLIGVSRADFVWGTGVTSASLWYETLIYDVLTGTTSTIMDTDTWMFASNPSTSEVALLSTTLGVEEGHTIVRDASIQIGTYAQQELVPQSEFPAGCDLQWSPDGVFLAYTNHGQPFRGCDDPILGVFFLNTARGEIVEYSAQQVIPLGWVPTPG